MPATLDPKLESIISRMVDAGESDEDIDFVVNDYKAKRGASIPTSPVASQPQEDTSPVQPLWQTAAYSFPQAFSKMATESVGGIAKMADTGADIVAKYTGTEKGGLFKDIADTMDDASRNAEEMYPVDERNPLTATIAGGAAQGVGLLAGGVGGKMVGLGEAALSRIPLALGAAQGASHGIDTANELGVESPEARLALGALFGGTEVLTEKMGGIGNQAAMEALRKPAEKLLKEAAKDIVGEGIEEIVAGSAQDFLARAFATEDPSNPGYTKTGVKLPEVNPLTKEFLQKRGMEFLGGAAGGAVFTGAKVLANAGRPVEGQETPPVPPPIPDTGVPDAPEITLEDAEAIDLATAAVVNNAEDNDAPLTAAELQRTAVDSRVTVESGMFDAPQMEARLTAAESITPADPTAQRDLEYLAAVEAGDMEKAQRLVDEAAKAAGMTELFHGSSANEDIKTFEDRTTSSGHLAMGVYMSPDIETAQGYGKTGRYWVDIDLPGYAEYNKGLTLEQIAKGETTPVEGRSENGAWKIENGAVEVVARKAAQIKSADPVLRDDQGNVIPLSKRFAARQKAPVTISPQPGVENAADPIIATTPGVEPSGGKDTGLTSPAAPASGNLESGAISPAQQPPTPLQDERQERQRQGLQVTAVPPPAVPAAGGAAAPAQNILTTSPAAAKGEIVNTQFDNSPSIGDAVTVMSVPGILAKQETHGGVRYELYNGEKLAEKRAHVRVYDADSGNVVSIKQYPTYDQAEADFNKAIRVAATTSPAPTRDASKPEQMTPDEFVKVINSKAGRRSEKAESFLRGRIRDGMKMAERTAGGDTAALGYVHRFYLDPVIARNGPVSAAAVDAYKIKLPDGYVRQGDLYVYKPEASSREDLPGDNDPRETPPQTPSEQPDTQVPPVDQPSPVERLKGESPTTGGAAEPVSFAEKNIPILEERIGHLQSLLIDSQKFGDSEFYDGTFPIPEAGGIISARGTSRYANNPEYRRKIDSAIKDVTDTIVNANRQRLSLMGRKSSGAFGVDYSVEKVRATYGVNVVRAWHNEAKQKYPYTRRLGNVSVREAFQNSLDAVLAAIQGRQVKQGQIDIDAASYNNTGFKIDDNGVGMSDTDIASKFLSLHSTGKAVEGRFGGFGIAKAVILGPSDTGTWKLHTRDNRFSHEQAQENAFVETAPQRQGTEIEVTTQEYIIDSDAKRYVETTDLPRNISVTYDGEPVSNPFKGLRAQKTNVNVNDSTSYEMSYYPKAPEGYAGKYLIRLVDAKTGSKLTQAIKEVYGDGFAGAIIVDVKTSAVPGTNDYPLVDSRMELKWGAEEPVNNLITKHKIDKNSAKRAGQESKVHLLTERPEWEDTLRKLDGDAEYQKLSATINKVWESTGKFFGSSTQQPFTPLENLTVKIDTGFPGYKGGSMFHAKHLAAYEAVSRLMSFHAQAPVSSFYALLSKPIEGGAVGAEHGSGGQMGLNYLIIDKTALKNPASYALYLRDLVAHELTHEFVGPHNEDFTSNEIAVQRRTAHLFPEILKIAEAVLGQEANFGKKVVERRVTVEKRVEVPVEKEKVVEKYLTPEQLEFLYEYTEKDITSEDKDRLYYPRQKDAGPDLWSESRGSSQRDSGFRGATENLGTGSGSQQPGASSTAGGDQGSLGAGGAGVQQVEQQTPVTPSPAKVKGDEGVAGVTREPSPASQEPGLPTEAPVDTPVKPASEKKSRVIKGGDTIRFKQEGVVREGTFAGQSPDGGYLVQVKGEKLPRKVSARSINDNNEKQLDGTKFSRVSENMEEVSLSDFSPSSTDDDYLYHVTTKDRVDDIVYEGGGLKPNQSGQFTGSAAINNSKGKIFLTEKSGVSEWAYQIEQQLFHSGNYDEEQEPADDLTVVRIPRRLVRELQDDFAEAPAKKGRDYFTTFPIPASGDSMYALPTSRASMPKDRAQAFLDGLGIPRSKVWVINEPSQLWRGRYDPDGLINLNVAHLGSTEELMDTLLFHENIHDAVETDVNVKREAEGLRKALTPDELAGIEAEIAGYEDSDKPDERLVEYVRLLVKSRPDLQTRWGRLVDAVVLAIKKFLGIKNLNRARAELVASRILARGIDRVMKGKTGGRVGGGRMYADSEERANFFSQLTMTIAALPQEVMTVQQARASIEKGAKKDEIAQQGLFTDPLSPFAGKQPNDKVTRKELLDYSTERAAKVEDVVLDDSNAKVLSFEEWVARQGYGEDAIREFGGSLRRSYEAFKQGQSGREGGTHFSQYQLPGADEGSYREMFVTWPESSSISGYSFREDNSGKAPPSGRWEILNDSGQVISRGFGSKDAARSEVARLVGIKTGSKPPVWNDGHSQYSDITNPVVRIRRNIRTMPDGTRTLFIEEIQGPNSDNQAKMPEYLRKRIYEIGMKRALRDAVDEGVDSISWTTGNRQAERYSLEKQLSKDGIKWNTYGENMVAVYAERADTGQPVIDGETYKLDKLPEVIGKGPAQQIADEVERGYTAGQIQGDNLKVGGEGLKRLYDSTLPIIANDLAKKAKADVRTGMSRVDLLQGGAREMGEVLDRQENPEFKTEPVHTLPIPPALKEHAKRGLPLFSLSPIDYARHAELEAKHDAGTITPEETAEAQAIVDRAAKVAGYDPTPLWHRTWSRFTSFVPGGISGETTSWFSSSGSQRTKVGPSGRAIFLSYNKEQTPAFHQQKKAGEQFIKGYARMRNPLVVDDDTRDFVTDVFADGFKDFPLIVTEEARKAIVAEGHDSVHLYYNGRNTSDGKPDEVIVLDPSQIKSADPFTGTPLRNRFDTQSPDIRYAPDANLGASGYDSDRNPVQGDSGARERGENSSGLSPQDNSQRANAVRKAASGIDWKNATAAERIEALSNFSSRVASGFVQSLPHDLLSTSVTSEASQRIGAWVMGESDGRVLVKINSHPDTRRSGTHKWDNPEAAFAYAYDMMQEESIHALQHGVTYRQWKKAGSPGSFQEFSNEKYAEAFREVLRQYNYLAKSGDTSAAGKIQSAIVSSWNLYHGETKVSSINELADLFAKDNRNVGNLIPELTRQLAQLTRQDFATETGWRKFYNLVKGWIKDSIDSLKTALTLARGGQLGPIIQQEISDLETLMKNFENGTPPPASSGTAGGGNTRPSQARFVSPLTGGLTKENISEEEQSAEADRWLAQFPKDTPLNEIIYAFKEQEKNLPGYVQNFAVAKLIDRARVERQSSDPATALAAQYAGQELGLIRQHDIGENLGRGLGSMRFTNALLAPYMKVLEAEGWLAENQDRIVTQKIEGGTKGGTEKVKGAAAVAGDEAKRAALLSPDSPALSRLLNKVKGDVKWADLFTNTRGSQKERQKVIYTEVSKHPALKDLSREEKLALTQELDKAWQREHAKIFKRELEKATLARNPKDKAKVEATIPKLLKLMNLGVFSENAFRDAVASEFGLKSMSQSEVNKAFKLAEELQAETPGSRQWSKKSMELAKTISGMTGVPASTVLAAYYPSSLLLSMRTAVGAMQSITEAFLEAIVGSTVSATAGRSPVAAFKGLKKFIAGIPGGALEGIGHFINGDRTGTLLFNEETDKWLRGNGHSPQPMGVDLMKSGNPLRKFAGAVMLASNRMLTGIDLATSTSIYPAELMWANSVTKTLKDGSINATTDPTAADEKVMRENVIREEFGGQPPNLASPVEAARYRAAMRGQLDMWYPPEVVDTARRVSSGPSYQGEVRGAMGVITDRIQAAFASGKAQADKMIAKNPQWNPVTRNVVNLAGGLSELGKAFSGTQFMGFVGRLINRNLQLVPGSRLAPEMILGRDPSQYEKDILFSKNLLGLAMIVWAWQYLNRPDDDDDKVGVEGDWSSLTPDQVEAKRTIGALRSSIWYKDAEGQKHYMSFANSSASWLLSALANLKELRANKPEEWAKLTEGEKAFGATVQGAGSVLNVSAMQQLAEMLGQGSAANRGKVTGIYESAARKFLGPVQGFIPTLTREIDFMTDPSYYAPQTLQERAKSVIPFLRRQANDGNPALGVFGNPSQVNRFPLSRTYVTGADTPAEKLLARMSEKGLYLPLPDERKGRKVGRITMTPDQVRIYVRTVGEDYQRFVLLNGERILRDSATDRDGVEKFISDNADRIKDRAALRAVRGG